MKTVIPVILCGGAGSRLWPVSREQHPKPFIRLKDGQSLLQKAFLRGAMLKGVNEILTVTSYDTFFKVEDEIQGVNERSQKTSFILEPVGRNTAAAIAVAALSVVGRKQSDSLLLILPADHLVLHAKPFQEAVENACRLASEGKLVLFGIQPKGPETGYGYIEAKGEKVSRFIEKPCLEDAKEFLKSGNFYWNSGMFCFRPDTMIAEMEQHCPEILNAARQCLEVSLKATPGEINPLALDASTFELVPGDSIDYALMEKSTQTAVVPCDIGWHDIGSFEALSELAETDRNGNSVQGMALLHDTRDCFIQSTERLVCTLGVNKLIIVDTPDALLVADRSQAQDVRKLYLQLKEEGNEAHKLHRMVYRPWGTYTILQEAPGFKVKRIEMKPKASLSLQIHKHRSEHWIVVSGRATVINGDIECVLNPGESTFIPAGNQHRLSNGEKSELVIVEVQCGEYLGEDDIVRLDDVYGRV